jgi:hypothetical protein
VVTEDHDASGAAREPADGLFAKLPDSRPGTRSPRRTSGERASAARAKPDPEPRAPQAAERPAPPPEAPQPSEAPQSGGGLEDVAWAGIAAAAEAATIGVRLASRAIEALRGNPGPR